MEPLEIVSWDSNVSPPRLCLNKDNLRRALSGCPSGRKIAVISVAGPFGTGKSFLLSLLVRYLRSLPYINQTEDFDWLLSDTRTTLTGFPFRSSTEVVTRGIYLLPQPILLNDEDGNLVALYLMDTQGFFESRTSLREWAGIVGTAMCASSNLILNVQKNLQEDTLEALETFLEYNKIMTSGTDMPASGMGTQKFQKVTFIVRDWNNPGEYDYGFESGSEFIRNKLQDGLVNVTEESQRMRRNIRDSIENFECCLLPHPGPGIQDIRYNSPSNFSSLPGMFTKQLKDCVEALLTTDNVQEKKFGQDFATTHSFFDALDTHVKTFNATFSTQVNHMNAAAQLSYEMGLLRLVKLYDAGVKVEVQKKTSVYSPGKFQRFHRKLKDDLLQQYSRYIPDPKMLEQYRGQLDSQIEARCQVHLAAVISKAAEFVGEYQRNLLDKIRKKLGGASEGFLLSDEFLTAWKTFSAEATQKLEQKLVKAHLEVEDPLQDFQMALESIFMEQEANISEIKTSLFQKHLHTIDDALERYTDKMETKLNFENVEGGTLYADPEVLQNIHGDCFAAATQYAEKQFQKLPEHAGTVRKSLEEQLDQKLTARFEMVKVKNREIKKETETSLRLIVENAVQEFQQEALSSGEIKGLSGLSAKLQKQAAKEMREQTRFCPSVQSAQKKLLDRAFNQETKRLQQQLESAKRAQDNSVKEAMSKILGEFSEKIQNRTESVLEPGEFAKVLDKDKADAIEHVQDVLGEVGQVEVLEQFGRALDLDVNRVKQKNLDNFNRFQNVLQRWSKSVPQKFEYLLQQKMSEDTKDPEALRKCQEEVEKQILQEVRTQPEFQAGPPAQVQQTMKQVVEKLQQLKSDKLRTWEENVKSQAKSTLLSAGNKLIKNLRTSLQDYLEKYNYINGDEFQDEFGRKAKQNLLDLEKTLNAQGISFEDITGEINTFKIMQNNLIQKFWQEDIQSQNETTETKIQSQFSRLKSNLHQNVSSDSFSSGRTQDQAVRKLLDKFKFTDDQDKQRFLKELQAKLREEEKVISEEQQKLHKQEEETKKQILQEFKDAINVTENPEQIDRILEGKIFEIPNLVHTQQFLSKLRKLAQAKKEQIRIQTRQSENEFQEFLRKLQENSRDKPETFNNFQEFKKVYGDQLEKEINRLKVPDPEDVRQEFSRHLQSIWDNCQAKKKVQLESSRPWSSDEEKQIEKAVLQKYDQEMEAHLKSSAYTHPDKLQELHSRALREAKTSQASLTRHSKLQSLEKALDDKYKVIEKRNNMNAPSSFAIGIDLGTTYSCVGVYIDGRVEIIPNDLGKKTTPSYVYIGDDGQEMAGEEAKNQAHVYPENTIYEGKRLIGRKMEDPSIQGDIKKWPFKVVNERGVPKVQVNGKTYHPEEISARVLIKLKEIAENYLKKKVTAAVITVPAYFNDGQKQATKDAGEAAGLDVLRIISEPTAAALAYNLQETDMKRKSRGVVYDLGGGTFDVALYKAQDGSVEILSIGGDTHLGGVDFDNKMVEFCAAEFKRIHDRDIISGATNSPGDSRRVMRLKSKCEDMKKLLSAADEVTVEILSFYNGEDLKVKITRQQFEGLIDDYITSSIEHVEKVLQSAKFRKEDLDEIILVGGSTRIPRVKQMLKDHFKKPLIYTVDPDEAVAVGAAYEAAVRNGAKALLRGDSKSAAIAPKKTISINDVTPMSYGLEVDGGQMLVLIPKQTKIPAKKACTFTTSYNNQTSVQVSIYEGDSPVAKQNTLVGDFYMNGIPAALAGVQKINVTMEVNLEGLITVSAVSEDNARTKKELQVRANKKRMTGKEIQEVMAKR